jgi:hypothetical protein
MPSLRFSFEKVEVQPFAVAPQLIFKLRLANTTPEETVHTVALRAQVMLEATLRGYSSQEQASLRDLFGEPERWSQTLKTFLWTHTSTVVPAFSESTLVNLPVPCTFDFNVAATKYFAGLEKGEVPLCVQFSGTVFYAHDGGPLQVMPVSWDQEVHFRMPVQIWRDLMEAYYPGTAWLCLQRDAFEQLFQYKVDRGIPTFEKALESLFRAAEERVHS